MTRTCPSCVAWRSWGSQRVSRGDGPVTDEPVGQCRRQAPTIDPKGISSTNAAWPTVSADDWCLAYQNPAAPLSAASSPSHDGGRRG